MFIPRLSFPWGFSSGGIIHISPFTFTLSMHCRMKPTIKAFHCLLSIAFLVYFLPKLSSTAGCSPPSMPSTVFCLLLSCSRWFPPSLLGHLTIFYLVVPLISSLSLIATLCSVWSTYCQVEHLLSGGVIPVNQNLIIQWLPCQSPGVKGSA